MTERYFEKFPLIVYDNNTCVDITKRTTLLNLVYNDPYSFYPYEITSNERADQLSSRYYNDAYQSWILYFSNKIVDPYYEWYLHDNEFISMLVLKYGSYDIATQKVKNYRNDWAGKDDISLSEYNSLAPSNKKYWEPNYAFNNKIISYKRKQADWFVNTNKIVSYTVSTTANFLENEVCTVYYGTETGKAQYTTTTDSKVYLQHVSGKYISSGSGYIVGKESGSRINFTSASLVISNIPSAEEAYWSPVTYFDFESELNEYNKTIRVIDKAYSQKLSDNLRTLMLE